MGLSRVMSTVSIGGGYAEALAGWSRLSGPFVRGEAGMRVRSNMGLFGFVQGDLFNTQLGSGIRVTW